jgi:ketosteroid isomerase-like protein
MPYCRLRNAAFVLILTIAAVFSLHAQSTPLKTASQQELDVIKVLLKQETAWNRGDIDAFAEGYKDSPDTLFINNQIQRGYSGMKDAYHRNYPNKEAMGQLTFSELEVHPIDEKVAVCVGKYHLDRSKKNGGNAEGLFSLVFEKTEAGWKIVVDHTT